jgi:AAA15 family ATPase/GTPase
MSDTSRHLTAFKVENFKRFESLELRDLGQFNLVVGDNNVGKTSVLEALLVTPNGLETVYSLIAALKFRNLKVNFTYDDIFLYHHKEKSPEQVREITFNHLLKNGTTNNIKIKSEKFSGKFSFQDGELKKPPHFIEAPGSYEANFSGPFPFPIIPFFKSHDSDLTRFYSSLQENRNLKKSFIQNLSTIVPDLDDILLSKPYEGSEPHLIVYRKHHDYSIPLALLGEGVIKLFRLLAEIVLNKGGRLMIDEVDAGIHYSRFKEFWKVILTAAKENDVQLFMTTHSKECMQYFVEALSDPDMVRMQKDARSIALVELPDKSVKSFTYPFSHLEANLTVGNEIR